MASTSVHPRRRPQKSLGTTSIHAMSLRKSTTFNARHHQDESPVEQSRYMPRRSQTCTKTLEELLPQEPNSTSSRQAHVAKLLQDFDDKINGRKPAGGDGSILKEEEVLAVPTFLLNSAIVPDLMDVDQKHLSADHQHESDSGLGSSVSSSKEDPAHRSTRTAQSISTTRSAVTRSASTIDAQYPRAEHFLSKEAERQIRKHIIKPILAEDSLKDFHPLIEDIPRRIGAKFITNLRDLEKTLFFLAPDFAPSPQSFLKFCETSIECLHTTVDYISERDQRRDTDRPYTNNYFLDLVEQIRRYAEIMAKTREKQASGQELDEMDYSPDEEIAIEGGLSKNGRPAELVRKTKDGKVIPLSDHSALNEGSPSTFKRHLTDDEDMDDDVYRSMARRRKSDKPGDVMHSCRSCDKEFKRPCDLTKHEKTHSRPWKCHEPNCKYHEFGWPTEKERDRHVNDKHNAAPQMYKCRFPPCTYSSKRESNCKQHMEKAHGWTYVRSKSNGRTKKPVASSVNQSPMESVPSFIATPSSAVNHLTSPESNFVPSPSVPVNHNFSFSNFGYTPGPSSSEDLFDFSNMRRQSVATTGSGVTFSSGSNFSPAQQHVNSAFEDALSPDNLTFDQGLFGADANIADSFPMPMQQPTPAMSVNHDYSSLSGTQHLSPAGHANMTLFTPQMDTMHFDEALGDEMGFGQDFTLFDATCSSNMAIASGNLYPEMGTIGGQFGDFSFPNANNFDDVFSGQQN
ncbi:uncharacterized protein PV09_01596 [Verruconis gallopava]|uniref:C2H2-type domain-containing protein n=1 Tax=Verruconis gallopava TaxID=253628 RepID=A0A0D2B8R4_9PEZI|nr:uncharacterized protein PV09_01596 [Verruconis gallopava]KIW07654.1 hypothetical protein PV09_01596 [Verruconis gallopava]